jgi:hypothetical protein
MLSGGVFCQTFTFIPADTVLTDTLGSEMAFNATITNTSSTAITVILVRTLNNLPVGWESAMCFDVCFPFTMDSIATTPAFGSSPLVPAESRPFSLHVFPRTTHGTGVVTITAWTSRDPTTHQPLTFTAITDPTSVEATGWNPYRYWLLQNYPNPFNPSTTVEFALPHSGFVTLKIFNILGEEVAPLVDEAKDPGTYRTSWDASGMASGVYLYRLQAGHFVETKKLLLLK